ncbi:hypothetical protein DRO97_09870 [Archaeoglobales archaeon]|nr:MAG: hypothetical protein DRO97_09870 [Archaeoglobales archaeon]
MEVVGYEAKGLVLRFNEGEELYGFKFDVNVLKNNDSEEWVEIFQADDCDGGTEANKLVLSAPLSEVVELLEKMLAFLRR